MDQAVNLTAMPSQVRILLPPLRKFLDKAVTAASAAATGFRDSWELLVAVPWRRLVDLPVDAARYELHGDRLGGHRAVVSQHVHVVAARINEPGAG